MTIFLETKRLIVKAPSLDDFNDLYQLQSDSDVMEYMGHGIRTESEVQAGLEKAIHHYAKYGFSLGSVFEKRSGAFIGRAGLIFLAFNDAQKEIEFGYGLLPAYWGKGYASELSQALINWGFERLNIQKLVAVINPKNERSRRVLEKTNMSYIGREKYNNLEVARYEIHKNPLDLTKVQLQPVSRTAYSVIQNMARFYEYDISEFLGFSDAGWAMPEDGLYDCHDYKKYWQSTDTFPFLIKYNKEIAGFVIVDKKGSDQQVDFNIAQFFILNKFKHRGLGSHVAFMCFEKYIGTWEVMVMPGNEAAYRFWRKTIQRYTNNHFKEYTRYKDDCAENRNFFQFSSMKEAKV